MAETIASHSSSLYRKKFRGALAGFGVLCLAAFALCSGCASVAGDRLAKPASRSDEADGPQKLGVKPVAIRLTAAGQMIDFRYRVVDPKKSLPLFSRQTKTYLVEQASGNTFAVPADTKLGPLRSSSREPLAGKEYFIIFANPGGQLQRGSRVTVAVGDVKIENLTIE
ncbi:MAG TPA: hypothetical protein VI298_08180 [Geobacteraceae bacterium]